MPSLPSRACRLFLDVIIQAGTLDEIHDEITGIVLFEIGVDPYDILVADELGKRLCLFHEALLAVFEAFAPLTVKRDGDRLMSCCKSIRKKLLDRNTLTRLMVSRHIRNTETALA